MWKNRDIKVKGMYAFRKNMLSCIIVSIITMIATGKFSFNFIAQVKNAGDTAAAGTSDTIAALTAALLKGQSLSSVIDTSTASALMTSLLPYKWMGAMTFGTALLAAAIYILVAGPAEAGACRFFIVNSNEHDKLTEVKAMLGIMNNYKTVTITMLLRKVLQTLWTILLIFPGVIKYYEYRFIPYLLAEYDTITIKEAFRLSKELTKGQKMNMFKYDLSFIGWYILEFITSGLASLLLVFPYKSASTAELYQLLKDQYMTEKHLTALL